MGQLDGGLLQVIGWRPSDAIGRSGLFTTSLPGCTPCTSILEYSSETPSRVCKRAWITPPGLMSREFGATKNCGACVRTYLKHMHLCTDMQWQIQLAGKQ